MPTNRIRSSSTPLRLFMAAVVVAGCNGAAPAASTSASASISPAASTPAASPSAAPSATASPSPSPSPIALFGPVPTTPMDTATSKRLQAAVDRMVEDGAPDAIAAVVTKDGAWTGAAGVDGPKGRRATASDAFGIASVTKTFLAALVVRLARQGKIDLDAPLATYLNGLAVDANGATVRQALAMRSGIGDTPGTKLQDALAHCDHALTREEVLATIPGPNGTPGASYHYSNPTYKLLGFAAEQATGSSLVDAMRTEVFEPAGVKRIAVQGVGSSLPKPWALPMDGHGGDLDVAKFGTGGTLPCLGFSTLSLGATAIAADASSVARWGWALFAGKVVDAEGLQTMLTPGDADGHGLGIDRMWDFPPDVAFGHAGSQAGYAALMTILPERPAVVVVFVNEANADVYAEAKLLIDALKG